MKTVGSRAEVWHGTAKKTSGGLLKKDLKKNKRGRIVSKKMSNRAKKEKRLEKAGYKTKKGVFKKFKAKKKGGMNSNNETNEARGIAAEMFEKANNEYNKNQREKKKQREKILFEQAMRGWPAPTTITSFLPDENLVRLAELGTTSLQRSAQRKLSEKKNKYLKNLISEHGSMDKALIEAAAEGKIGTVRILLNAGADKDARDKYDMTPLHYASRLLSVFPPDIVKLLLDAGADKDAKTKWGSTPLHDAAGRGRTDIVKLLLDAGADKDVRERMYNKTPLHFAVDQDYTYKAFTNIVKLLLDKGANKEVKDKYGRTPLAIAEDKGHTDIVELLKSHHKSKGGSKKRRKRKTTKKKTTNRKTTKKKTTKRKSKK